MKHEDEDELDPEDEEIDAIVEQMLCTPPRCLDGFRVEQTDRPEKWPGSYVAVWRLNCPCGSANGHFLGYPLRRYVPTYSGNAFIGPLAFQCVGCSRVTEILDTDQHGYDAEACSGGSSVTGEGPRETFGCPGCTGNSFNIVTSFFFWPASMDLVMDEPEEFMDRAQDLFCEFVAHGFCANCKSLSRFTDFGKF